MHHDQCRRTALIVEDEALIRADIADALRGAGWHVFESASAERAIELLKEQNFSVVFTDIQLQGRLTGWDVAEACRTSRPGMVVIYTSGNVADRARSVEGSRFFDKPYRVADILEACTVDGA